MQLDTTDFKILALLQHDAKLTNKEIADKVSKSSTSVYERIKKLEEEGFITNYVALLNSRKIERSLIAFTTIQLKQHEYLMLKQFEKEIVTFNEVMECYHMTGINDYMLKIAIKDMDEYQNFIVNKLAKFPNVRIVQSAFVMTEIKHSTAFGFE
jgi:DNA-binding Lrp family transcriptional regulator